MAKATRKALAQHFIVVRVRCQKICKGPVVGAEIDGEIQWFRKLDVTSDLVPLRKSLLRDRITKPLRGKRVKKRTGKLR